MHEEKSQDFSGKGRDLNDHLQYTLADCMGTKTSTLWLIIKKQIKAARCFQISSPQHWLKRNWSIWSYKQIRSTLVNWAIVKQPYQSHWSVLTYTVWILPICIVYSSILPPGQCVNMQLQGGWHRYRARLAAVGSVQEEDFYAKDRNIAKRADMRAAGCHHMLNQSKTKPSVTAKELPTRVSDVLSTL